MTEEEKRKLKGITAWSPCAVATWNERKRLLEKKYKNEGEKEREIQADIYYRAWSQMSNALRDEFPELWTEFNK